MEGGGIEGTVRKKKKKTRGNVRKQNSGMKRRMKSLWSIQVIRIRRLNIQVKRNGRNSKEKQLEGK